MKAYIFFFLFFFLPFHSVSGATLEDSSDDDLVLIYKYDSDKEDCDQPVIELWDAQKILEAQGLTVFSAGIGYDGLMYSIEDWGCDSDPTRIHLFSVRKKDGVLAQEWGFEFCSDLEKKGGKCHPISYSDLNPKNRGRVYVSIYKSAGEKVCEPNSGKSVNDMEQELAKDKIVVYQRYSAVDGLSYPLVCGGNTEYINVYVIEKQGLERSHALGFRECAWLSKQGGGCFLAPSSRSSY